MRDASDPPAKSGRRFADGEPLRNLLRLVLVTLSLVIVAGTIANAAPGFGLGNSEIPSPSIEPTVSPFPDDKNAEA